MSGALRICLLVHSTLPRGGVVHALELGDALGDAGHAVDLCAPDADGAGLFRAPRSPRCRFVPIPDCRVDARNTDHTDVAAPRLEAGECGKGDDKADAAHAHAHATDAKLVAWVARRIDDWLQYFETTPGALDYDIYHAQDSVSANALAILVERGRIAGYTRTVHHLDDFADARLSAWQRRGFLAARQVFCVSERWRDRLWRDYGIRAACVSNGVDRLRFSPECSPLDYRLRARLSLPLAFTSVSASATASMPTSTSAFASALASASASTSIESGPVFLSVGGIESRKNTLNALAGFVRVRRHHPGARWLIAGGASLLDHDAYVQRFHRAIQIADQDNDGRFNTVSSAIHLLGRIDDADMPSLFRIADALLFPSSNEGFGLVVLEALSCATPVVTSRIAPFTEYLPPDAVDWADPNDPQSIADAMLAAVADRGHSHRRQQAGFAVCDAFGWARSAATHLTLYRALRADLQSDFPMETSHA